MIRLTQMWSDLFQSGFGRGPYWFRWFGMVWSWPISVMGDSGGLIVVLVA